MVYVYGDQDKKYAAQVEGFNWPLNWIMRNLCCLLDGRREKEEGMMLYFFWESDLFLRKKSLFFTIKYNGLNKYKINSALSNDYCL